MGRIAQKRLQQFWWVIPVVLLITSGATAWYILQTDSVSDKVVIEDCSGDKSTDTKCWKRRYEAIVTNETPKAAFTDVRAAYEAYPIVKSDCHQIAHIIGRTAAKKYGDVVRAYNEGDNFCWSGYYHGVMEGIAKELGPDGLVTNIATICEGAKATQIYSFYHYNCVHGLGHGVMAVENNHLFDSLKDCDGLNDSWERDSCYGGVFMENVMSSQNPEHRTDYIKADDPLYPCTDVDIIYKQQCYLMQTSHALRVEEGDFSRVFNLCSTVEQPFNTTCYQSLGRDASGNSVSDITRTRESCLLGHDALAQENCFTGAVKDFISYFHSDQQGLALCKSIPDASLKTSCVNEANEYYKSF